MIKWDRTKGRPEPIRLLNFVLELENCDPLVDMRVASPSVRFPKSTTIPYARQKVAEMAERAAQSLPSGYFLAVTDAWRPFLRQKLIYEFMWKCGEEAFPHLDYAQLRRKINRWVAPIDQKAPPGHCTGAALDVILEDEAGELIDVFSPFNRFSAAPTFCFGLTETATKNRMILHDAMIDAGFSNCRDEWWHYSYGDAGWAVRMGLNECCYGLVELDESLYEEAQKEWIKVMKSRPNPFIAGL